jgi:Ca2+-transporting ATPase
MLRNGDEWTLLGLEGLKDPRVLPRVKKAIEDCEYAGVNMKIITGYFISSPESIST